MEFGKTPFYKDVEYFLPREKHYLDFNYHDKPNIYIGAPQWNQKEWIGRIYPKGSKGSDFLYHYSRRFNTIELNSTHYALPSMERIQRWKDIVPDSFKFCPKIPQRISHYGLKNIKSELKLFLDTVTLLKEKLGVSFIQLPPSFTLNEVRELERFIDLIPHDFKIAIEFRHHSFFDKGVLYKKVSDLMNRRKISSIITDTAGRRDLVHQTITTDQALLRFVGNDHDETDFKRIDNWIININALFEQGLKDFYFFSHQPNNIFSIDLAQYFVKRINEQLGTNFIGPLDQKIENDEEKQISLF